MAPVHAAHLATVHLRTLVSRQNVAIPSSVITGVVAGVAVFFVIFFVGLGTWICCHYKKPKNRGHRQKDNGAWRQSEDTLITSRWSNDSLGKNPARPASYDYSPTTLSRSSSDRPLDIPSEGLPARPAPVTTHSQRSAILEEQPMSKPQRLREAVTQKFAPGKIRKDRY